jgi:hypothetical protein
MHHGLKWVISHQKHFKKKLCKLKKQRKKQKFEKNENLFFFTFLKIKQDGGYAFLRKQQFFFIFHYYA